MDIIYFIIFWLLVAGTARNVWKDKPHPDSLDNQRGYGTFNDRG